MPASAWTRATASALPRRTALRAPVRAWVPARAALPAARLQTHAPPPAPAEAAVRWRAARPAVRPLAPRPGRESVRVPEQLAGSAGAMPASCRSPADASHPRWKPRGRLQAKAPPEAATRTRCRPGLWLRPGPRPRSARPPPCRCGSRSATSLAWASRPCLPCRRGPPSDQKHRSRHWPAGPADRRAGPVRCARSNPRRPRVGAGRGRPASARPRPARTRTRRRSAAASAPSAARPAPRRNAPAATGVPRSCAACGQTGCARRRPPRRPSRHPADAGRSRGPCCRTRRSPILRSAGSGSPCGAGSPAATAAP